MYILCFDFKDTTENQEFNFLNEICETKTCSSIQKSILEI